MAEPAWPHPRRPRAAVAPRAVRLAAALAGLAAIAAYLFVALRRLGYPFPVEWLESNSLVEVHRILAGQPLYPAPTVGVRSRRLPAAVFRRVGRRGPGARRLLPDAAAGLPRVLAVLLRAARPAGPARDGQRRGRGRGRGPVRRGLLRHRHVVRRRPGRLAFPRAEHRRPVRRPVDARHARCRRRRGAARRRGAHEADRARRGGRGGRRAAGRSAPQARLRRRAHRDHGAGRQHARARAGQRRLVRLLRLRADERALADRQQFRLVLDGPGDRDGPGRVRRPDRRAPGTPRPGGRLCRAGGRGLRRPCAQRRRHQRRAARVSRRGAAGRPGARPRSESGCGSALGTDRCGG